MQNLKEDEELIDVIHKHWASLAPMYLKVIALFIIPSLFIRYILGSQIATIIYLIYLALLLAYLVYSWAIWYFDAFVITDKRIIDIEQKGLFTRSVSEAPLSRVQDVTYQVGGFFATLFNYGSVSVKTASQNDLTMEKVKDPEDIQEIISELQALAHSDKKMSAEDLVSYISDMKERRDSGGSDEDESEAAEEDAEGTDENESEETDSDNEE